MAIAILFSSKDPMPWKEVLENKLQEEVYIHPVDHHVQKDINFLICWKPLPGSIEKYQNVKVIQSIGAGIDHLYIENTISKEIIITRIKDEKLLEDMYEYVLAVILAHIKNVNQYHQDKIISRWKPISYKRIEDTAVSFLGLGYLGAGVAVRLQNMGFRVQGWASSVKHIQQVKTYVGDNGLQEMLSSTDILINLLPLTQKTENILNRALFSQLNKAYLINVGRGHHLVEEDLIAALDEEKLIGACLDVFRDEPLPADHRFWKDDRLFITPHVSGITDKHSVVTQLIKNYRNMQQGKPVDHMVNLEKGY